MNQTLSRPEDHRADDATQERLFERMSGTSLTITRFTHACVSVETSAGSVIIDPGEFGEVSDLTRYDAILITHDHFDHVDVDALRSAAEHRPDLLVVWPDGLDPLPVPGLRVADGETLTVGAGLSVKVYGTYQAVADLTDPPIPNVAYLVDGRVLHPGDSFTAVPGVDVLLLPVAGPWTKLSDQQRHVDAVRPRWIMPIHDVTLNEVGLEFAERTVARLASAVDASPLSLRAGEAITLR